MSHIPTFSALPSNILLVICSYLDASNLVSLSCTCTRFHDLLSSNTYLWNSLYRHTFGSSLSIDTHAPLSPSKSTVTLHAGLRRSISHRFKNTLREEKIHVPTYIHEEPEEPLYKFKAAYVVNKAWQNGQYSMKRGRGSADITADPVQMLMYQIVTALSFLPSSETLLTCHTSGSVKLHSPLTPNRTLLKFKPCAAPISHFAFHPSLPQIACISTLSARIYIHDYTTGESLTVIPTEHRTSMTCVTFDLTTSSTRLITGSEDRSIQAHDLATKELVQTLAYLPAPPLTVTTAPRALLITTDITGYIKVYSTLTWDCMRVFHLYPIGIRAVHVVVDTEECDEEDTFDSDAPAGPIPGMQVIVNAVTTAGQVLEFKPSMIPAPEEEPIESALPHNNSSATLLEQPILNTLLSPTMLHRPPELPPPSRLHSIHVPKKGSSGPFLERVYTQSRTTSKMNAEVGLDASYSGVFVMGKDSLYELRGHPRKWDTMGAITHAQVFGEWMVVAGEGDVKKWHVLKFGAVEKQRKWMKWRGQKSMTVHV